MPEHTHETDKRRHEITREIAGLGYCLPGSVSARYLRCGNPRCRCQEHPDNRHGPYTYWTRKEHGRTIARLLSTEQTARYQPQIDNARRLRQLVTALEALAIHAAEDAETWGRK